MGVGNSTGGICDTLVDSKDEVVREVAAQKLCEKAKKYTAHEDYIKAVCDNAGKPLIAMLAKGTEKGKNHAAAALSYIALNADNKSKLAEFGAIPALVKLLKEGTPELKGAAAAALANLPTRNPKNQAAMAEAGVIAPLVEMVKSGLGEAKGWAASALGNLASQHKKNLLRVAEAGAIPAILELAKAKAVPSTAADAPRIDKFEYKVLAVVACRPCRKRAPPPAGSRNRELAARALSHLAYDSVENQAKIVKADGVETLLTLAKEGSSRDAVEALRALGIVWAKDTKMRERIANAGGVPIFVEKIQNGCDEEKASAANMIGRLIHEDASARDSVVTHEGIPALVKLANDGANEAKLPAIRALKELCNGSPERVKLVQEAGGKPLLDRLEAQSGMSFRELTPEEEAQFNEKAEADGEAKGDVVEDVADAPDK